MTRDKHEKFGERFQIASALLDSPRTPEELLEYFRTMGRRFGVFPEVSGWFHLRARDRSFDHFLTANLASMQRDGWITETEEGYCLTDCGREKAERFVSELRRGGAILRRLTAPQTVSTVTLITHFALAAVKLPAAILSHSVGLLNDSLDTLADGLSSLLVYFGVRKGRERLVSYILLAFMGFTGILTAIEAIGRIVSGSVPSADPVAFIAVAVSAVFCAGLWVYQRYVGSTKSCVPLIAQSIDSRNHVIVAFAVALGLLAAAFHVPYVDGVVGLVVSALIVRGAVELLIELLRSENGEAVDLSAYGFSGLERHRERSLVRWLLLQVDNGKISSSDELERQARESLDFHHITSFEALGISDTAKQEATADAAVRRIREDGLVYGQPLALTNQGREELDAAFSRRLFGGAGGPLVTTIRAVVLSTGSLIATFVFGLLAAGIRWILQYMPSAPVWGFQVLDEGNSVWSIFGVPVSATDAWLAIPAAAFFLLGRFRQIRHRRNNAWMSHPGDHDDPKHNRPRGDRTDGGTLARTAVPGGLRRKRLGRPILTRAATSISLVLLTNSWWTVGLAGLTGITALIERAAFRRHITGRLSQDRGL